MKRSIPAGDSSEQLHKNNQRWSSCQKNRQLYAAAIKARKLQELLSAQMIEHCSCWPKACEAESTTYQHDECACNKNVCSAAPFWKRISMQLLRKLHVSHQKATCQDCTAGSSTFRPTGYSTVHFRSVLGHNALASGIMVAKVVAWCASVCSCRCESQQKFMTNWGDHGLRRAVSPHEGSESHVKRLIREPCVQAWQLLFDLLAEVVDGAKQDCMGVPATICAACRAAAAQFMDQAGSKMWTCIPAEKSKTGLNIRCKFLCSCKLPLIWGTGS